MKSSKVTTIVFEGLDNTGKSSIIKYLQSKFPDNIITFKEPSNIEGVNGTKLCLRDFLFANEHELSFDTRSVFHILSHMLHQNYIQNAIRNGTIRKDYHFILFDRSFISGLVYDLFFQNPTKANRNFLFETSSDVFLFPDLIVYVYTKDNIPLDNKSLNQYDQIFSDIDNRNRLHSFYLEALAKMKSQFNIDTVYIENIKGVDFEHNSDIKYLIDTYLTIYSK